MHCWKAQAREEGEVELERIVFADIRRVSAIFKSVVKDAQSAAYHQLWIDLVGNAYSRGKIGFWRGSKPGYRSIRDG